jgi:hypothetical protein
MTARAFCIARKVIEIDRAGTRHPEEISKLAAKQLGIL